MKIKTKKTPKTPKTPKTQKKSNKNSDLLPTSITTHKYSKYYPSILDPTFIDKITHHPIYKKYKLHVNKQKLDELYTIFENNKLEDIKKTPINTFILKPTQKLLRNFINPYTPYRNLLIYHEMGVGKTCTAITIAEALKTLIQNSGTKIYILRPQEIIRQIFEINKVKKRDPIMQCTGDTYLQNPKYLELIDLCMDGNEHNCDLLKSKIDKELKQFYEFISAGL